MITAMSLPTRCQGSVMCTPFAGRIEPGWTPSSSARTSSAHTPQALTIDRAATSIDAPSASTTAPATRPSRWTISTNRQRLTTTAPCSAAVRAIVSVSRASSVAASK